MTRKCVLCKETNYKNSYSFFSAPKDPETRKKWQAAIPIENYTVTDDTYVCSKHFYKRDIITHWVSGVPPHTVTIKYKKCRLRPGAVPVDKVIDDDDKRCSASNLDSKSNGKTNTSERSECKNQENRDQTKHKTEITCDTSVITTKDNIILEERKDTSRKVDGKLSDSEFNRSTSSRELCYLEGRGEKEEEEEEEMRIELEVEEGNGWKHIVEGNNVYIREKCIDEDEAKTNESSCYTHQQLLETLSDDHLDTQDYSISKESSESGMLFEDLLEVCSEISLPRGWSCVVTSKGHGTTIVYLKMSVTKTGMPFIQKQVFIKTDMTLRCSIMDKEIDPFAHNLIKDGRGNSVRSPLDIQEFINEFDEKRICKGVYNLDGIQGQNYPKIMLNDGSKWRHIHCPLIVNNDTVRCSRCILLSQALKRKLGQSLASSHNSEKVSNEQWKIRNCKIRRVQQ